MSNTPEYLKTHDIAGDDIVYALDKESAGLAEKVEGDHRKGKPLTKQPGLAVVLVSMGKGNRLGEHATDGPATVQVINGHVTFHVGDDTLDLKQHEIAILGPGVRHDAEALEPSTLLITVAEGNKTG